MPRTHSVVAIYGTHIQAEQAVKELQRSGFDMKNISIVGVYWDGLIKADPGYLARTQQAIETLWDEGKVRPEVSATWPLSKLPYAMRALQERRVTGKAVLLTG